MLNHVLNEALPWPPVPGQRSRTDGERAKKTRDPARGAAARSAQVGPAGRRPSYLGSSARSSRSSVRIGRHGFGFRRRRARGACFASFERKRLRIHVLVRVLLLHTRIIRARDALTHTRHTAHYSHLTSQSLTSLCHVSWYGMVSGDDR